MISEKKEYISKLNNKIHGLNIEITTIKKEMDKYKHSINVYNRLQEEIKKYTNYQYIRTYCIKKIRDKVYEKYINSHVYAHSLDASIKRACSSYKSGITNLLEKNIKRFRVKCLSSNKGLIEMEPQTFYLDNDNNYQISPILKNMYYTYRGNEEFKLKDKTTSSFYFDGIKYWLLHTQKIEEKELNVIKKPYIGLDGGIREFLNGFTENSAVTYGTDIYNIIRKYLCKIDNLNGEQTIEKEIEQCKKTIEMNKEILFMLEAKPYNKITKKHIIKLNNQTKYNENRIKKLEIINNNIKNKNEYEKYMSKRRHDKANYYYKIIHRKVTEAHWKIAIDLAKNYEIVIIGKINMKSICQNEELAPMVKRVGALLRHYEFRSKLEYICLSYGTKFIASNEKYTTKMCSVCGHYNTHVKGEKLITCKGCGRTYLRDNYSARGITISNLLDE